MRNRGTRRARSILIGLVLMSLPGVIWAEVAEIPLKKLVARSDLIIVARVTKVEDGSADPKPGDERFSAVRVATADVIQTWKGAPVREVRFRASPTWDCDISTAKEGEQVVLFLTRSEGKPIMMIGHAGRGRLPLRVVKGDTYATFWDDVRLPDGTATIPGPEPEYSFIRSVELTRLRELVRRELVRKKGP